VKTYAPDVLRIALETALEDKLNGKSLAEFYGGPPQAEAARPSSRPGWSGDHWTAEMPDAERELRRDLDALQHVSADCPRDQWRRAVGAIADRHLGSDVGHAIACAWSLGGTAFGVTFPQPNGDYTADDFEACWRDACRNPHFSIATVFHLAKEAGWNSSRRRWGLGRVQRPGKPLSAAALQVREAGLAMPRREPNLERIAWYWHLIKATRRPDLRDVAFVIAFSINIGSGFSWRTFESIASLLDWQRGPKGEGFRRVSRAVRDLTLLDFIVRSPGNERGAHGRIGPIFALTLPEAMTWGACVAGYRADFGGPTGPIPNLPDLAATGTARDWSKPKNEVQTHTATCGSLPNSNGSDQQMNTSVQTTRSLDQHQSMPVHLNVNSVAGGEDALLRASPRTNTSAIGQARTADPAEPARLASREDRAPQPEAAITNILDAADGWPPEDFWGPTKANGDRQ
jgi:hypothetical protein